MNQKLPQKKLQQTPQGNKDFMEKIIFIPLQCVFSGFRQKIVSDYFLFL